MKFGGFIPMPPILNFRIWRRQVVSVDPPQPHQSARHGCPSADFIMGQSLLDFLPLATRRIGFFAVFDQLGALVTNAVRVIGVRFMLATP
jgi:hypothetical protein